MAVVGVLLPTLATLRSCRPVAAAGEQEEQRQQQPRSAWARVARRCGGAFAAADRSLHSAAVTGDAWWRLLGVWYCCTALWWACHLPAPQAPA